MNKQEAINKLKSKKILGQCLSNYAFGYNEALDEAVSIVKQLDEQVRPPEPKPLELEKPVVPRCVADMIVERKKQNQGIVTTIKNLSVFEKSLKWVIENEEDFVKAWLYGYEVEKEKLYTVEIPNPNHEERPILFKKRDEKVHIVFPSVPCWRTVKNAQLTESEIKQDFEWAWQFAEEVKE